MEEDDAFFDSPKYIAFEVELHAFVAIAESRHRQQLFHCIQVIMQPVYGLFYFKLSFARKKSVLIFLIERV
jgi:hypothetical protein